jgi:hypothetical protein
MLVWYISFAPSIENNIGRHIEDHDISTLITKNKLAYKSFVCLISYYYGIME